MKSIRDELQEHPFFAEFNDEHLNLISGCAKNVVFKEDEAIAREGQAAEKFYLIRQGRVIIETTVPGKGTIICQTLKTGDVLGWSWLFRPHRWTFDVTAADSTRTIEMDGKCLAKKCNEDHELGYHMMKKFAEIMTNRLQMARFQLMDVYGQQESK
jgi:CRP-like cAMP-binding protein